jgi:hypothetical protein
MAKFGIDSNMVFDANGKSVAARLSDHDVSLDGLSSSLADRVSQLNSIHINALYPPSGVTAAKGDGITDDTTALNNLMQYCYINGYALYLPTKTYKITGTLTIGFYPRLKIIGSENMATIVQYTNNIPIFQTTTKNTHSVHLRNLDLKYNTQQNPTDHPNSYAIAFNNNEDNMGGHYYWKIDNVWVENATIGIGINQTFGNLPLWDCEFTNIFMTYISKTALNICSPSPAGVLGIIIKNFKVLNGDGTLVTTGPALKLRGECLLESIDIECWYNLAISWDTANGEINGLHIESHYLTGTYLAVISLGDLFVNMRNLSLTYIANDTNLADVNFISCTNLQANIDGVWLNRQSGTKNVILISTNKQANLTNIRLNTSGDSIYKYTTWQFLTLDGKTIPQPNTPTSGTYTLGQIFYNSIPTSGGYLGWVCTRAGKIHPSSTASATNGSNTLTSVSDISNWSVGDKPICPGIGDGTTITAVNTTNSTLTLSSTFQAGSGTVTLNEGIFKSFGLIS